MTRKKVLIIFPESWIAFSPSTINLYDALAPAFDVTILAREPGYFSTQRLPGRTVDYVRIPRLVKSLAMRLKRRATIFGVEVELSEWLGIVLMLARAVWHRSEIVIGVDFLGMCIAQRTSGQAHLLSLEVNRQHPFFQAMDRAKITSVIIQSDERYEHLFPDQTIKRFIVQNAPVYRGPPSVPERRDGLVFSGTALREFGVFACLDFVRDFPEFSLTIQGAVPKFTRAEIKSGYPDLLARRRVLIESKYIDLQHLPAYLSQFQVGFCLYDLKYPAINTFNYHTAPSGKLFAYFAAGVPVICSNVRGLRAVADFDAGVMVDDLSPRSLRAALETVLTRHAEMSRNCLAAAAHFSFDRAIAPFVEWLRLADAQPGYNLWPAPRRPRGHPLS
jgi:glycosyltransferase involved in cell wall biosynthesis